MRKQNRSVCFQGKILVFRQGKLIFFSFKVRYRFRDRVSFVIVFFCIRIRFQFLDIVNFMNFCYFQDCVIRFQFFCRVNFLNFFYFQDNILVFKYGKFNYGIGIVFFNFFQFKCKILRIFCWFQVKFFGRKVILECQWQDNRSRSDYVLCMEKDF